MEDEENIEQSPQDGKTESPEEANSKNISKESSTGTKEQPTSKIELQTENMEVHHHPDLHHKKKNFREYFLEFLMIFLAVTMGFFAESLRENISEKRIEKDYIKSFVADLKEDTSEFNYIIPKEETSIKGLDTMLNILIHRPYTDSSMKQMYYLYRKYTMSIDPMKYTLRTITQLKNSGGLRLISDKQASDSIVAYNKTVDNISDILNYTTHDFMIPAVHVGDKIFNAKFLLQYDGGSIINIFQSREKMSLLTSDEATTGEYTNLIYLVKQIRENYLNQIKWHEERAKDMISFFEKEYHLENE